MSLDIRPHQVPDQVCPPHPVPRLCFSVDAKARNSQPKTLMKNDSLARILYPEHQPALAHNPVFYDDDEKYKAILPAPWRRLPCLEVNEEVELCKPDVN